MSSLEDIRRERDRREKIAAVIEAEEAFVRMMRSDIFRMLMADALERHTTADQVIEHLVAAIEAGTTIRRMAMVTRMST